MFVNKTRDSGQLLWDKEEATLSASQSCRGEPRGGFYYGLTRAKIARGA